MNRIAVCTFVATLSSLALGQDLSRTVDFDSPATRASILLADLSKATGVSFQAAANLKDEVFVVHAHGVTLEALMQRIAKAEGGVWSLQSGTYFLTRDRSTTLDQERAELKNRAIVIGDAIAKLKAKIDSQAPFSETTAAQLAEQAKNVLESAGNGEVRGRPDLSAAADKSPATRAIAQLLASIEPAKLAQIAPGQRVVFSTQPTNVQLGLNGVAYSAFRQFVAEQEIFTRTYSASQPADGQNRAVFMNGFGTPSMGNGNPKLGLGLGLVIIQRRFSDGLEVQIIAADPNLDTLATGSYSLQMARPAAGRPAKAGEQPLEISNDAKQIAKALSSGSGGSGIVMTKAVVVGTAGKPGSDFSFQIMSPDSAAANIKLSAELRSKILNPEKFDPLAFVPGEAITALAADQKTNVVALLPDTCFVSMSRQFADPVTASQFLASMGPVHALQVSSDSGWLVVSPALPFSARASALSRPALGNLLRKMDKSGWLGLDDVVSFALAENRSPGMSDLDTVYPRLINGSVTDRQLVPLATGSFSVYRFYGTLSDDQKRALAGGRNLALGNFGPQQIAMISDLVYNSPAGPSIDAGSQTPDLGGNNVNITVRGERGGPPVPVAMFGGFSAKTERTIVLPNGIPTDGFLQGSIATESIVQALNSQTGASSMVDASGLALSRAAISDPNLAGMASTWDRFRSAHQTNISLKFNLTLRVTLSRNLSDQAPDSDAQTVAYDALPADFRQRVDQIAQQMQQAFGKIPGGGRQGPPPPSR